MNKDHDLASEMFNYLNYNNKKNNYDEAMLSLKRAGEFLEELQLYKQAEIITSIMEHITKKG